MTTARTMHRRKVPLEQCACPREKLDCLERATGEDRLCNHCRDYCKPDESNR